MARRIDVPRNFEAALRKRGVAFTLTDDGRYQLERPAVIVSLDNLQRDVARDGNAEAIEVFVERVLEPPDSRTWAQVRPFVRFSAEPNDLEFHDTIRTTVSRQVERVLTVTDRNETRIRWVTPAMLKAWKVSHREAQKAAGESLNRLLRGTRLQVETIGTMRLGMVPIDSAFKASVIFAPGLRAFVEPRLGWPVLAVTPCRDFMYLFPETDFELVSRSAAVVLREYATSGYPITTEVWRISSKGLEAIGALGPAPKKKR